MQFFLTSENVVSLSEGYPCSLFFCIPIEIDSFEMEDIIYQTFLSI